MWGRARQKRGVESKAQSNLASNLTGTSLTTSSNNEYFEVTSSWNEYKTSELIRKKYRASNWFRALVRNFLTSAIILFVLMVVAGIFYEVLFERPYEAPKFELIFSPELDLIHRFWEAFIQMFLFALYLIKNFGSAILFFIESWDVAVKFLFLATPLLAVIRFVLGRFGIFSAGAEELEIHSDIWLGAGQVQFGCGPGGVGVRNSGNFEYLLSWKKVSYLFYTSEKKGEFLDDFCNKTLSVQKHRIENITAETEEAILEREEQSTLVQGRDDAEGSRDEFDENYVQRWGRRIIWFVEILLLKGKGRNRDPKVARAKERMLHILKGAENDIRNGLQSPKQKISYPKKQIRIHLRGGPPASRRVSFRTGEDGPGVFVAFVLSVLESLLGPIFGVLSMKKVKLKIEFSDNIVVPTRFFEHIDADTGENFLRACWKHKLDQLIKDYPEAFTNYQNLKDILENY